MTKLNIQKIFIPIHLIVDMIRKKRNQRLMMSYALKITQ